MPLILKNGKQYGLCLPVSIMFKQKHMIDYVPHSI